MSGPALPDRVRPASSDVFSGGGEMGELMRDHDWSATTLGPVEGWAPLLRTAVRILLGSRYAMWIGWGPELTFLYNDAYARILGAKHPWALGKPTRVVWSEIWDDIAPRIETVLANGTATWDEALMLFLERSGYPEETYHTFSYSPLVDDRGRVAGMLCVVTEETERVIGERRLRVLREVAARISDARTHADVFGAVERTLRDDARDLPFSLTYLLDGEGDEVLLASRTGVAEGHPWAPASLPRRRGEGVWPVAEVLERATAQDVPTPDGPTPPPTGPWDRPPERALAMPITWQGQNGATGVFMAGLNPFRPLDAEYRGFLELFVGQIAVGLGNANAYEEERRRAEALAEIDRAKTVFFSNISHEFRTPLTLLMGPTEDVLKAGDLPLAHRERLEVVHRNALRLQKLVNTLLDFSRIEAGRTQATYLPTDLSALTAELASMFRSATERAGLELDVDAPGLGEPAYVDREMWEKIVLNLLSNAFKFTFEGGITVGLHREGKGVRLMVKDTGTGIPAAEVPHLFERFHRVEGARGRTHEGSGIGLALVQELVTLHGGSIDVESEVDVGTTFTVRLPLGSGHLPRDRVGGPRSITSTAAGAATYVEEALRWLPAPGPEGAAPRPNRADRTEGSPAGAGPDIGHVLLADDNADMRDYVRRLLEGTWRVTAVADGVQALAAAREQPPDLILSDVMMPGLDGFGLLAELRRDPSTRDVPVVLLSARAGEDARIEGVEAGADDYIVKPFSGRELLARVGAHLDMARVRRETAATLRESEERFRNMADHAPVIVWVTDPDGRCTYLNRRWHELTGQTREEALGLGRLDAVHPDEAERARATFLEANRNEAAFRLEYRLRRADGEYVWALDTAAPRHDADGAFLGYIGSVIDITDRKRGEEERERLLEAEHRARTQAEEANRTKAQFLATMSHELRTPLNAIIGFWDLLAAEVSGPLTPGQRNHLDRIERAARHLLQIIDEILSFSRAEAGQEKVHLETVELGAVVRESGAMVEPLGRARGLRLRVRTPAEPVEVLTDPGKVWQILLNLLSNAVKFTEEGTVTVKLLASPATIRIRVSDTGIGIPAGERERLFEPFRQVERPGRVTTGGTGLGLSVSQRLARLLGGDILLESEEGEGSAFTLRLPRRPPVEPHPQTASATRRPDPREGPEGQSVPPGPPGMGA